jgi:hypothetical protein
MTASLQADVRAVLFLVDPTNPRFSQDQKLSIEFLCDLFGESATQMVKIVACRATKAEVGNGSILDIGTKIEQNTNAFATTV